MASRRKENETTWYAAKSEKYDGREYYYNPKTKESTWILPDDLHPNPNECTYSPSCEDTDRDDHHDDDDTLLVDAGHDDAAVTTRQLVKNGNDNENHGGQTNRNIGGRSVGVLLCLLAICAIMHTWSLKGNNQDVPATTGEVTLEQTTQQRMQPPRVESEMEHEDTPKAEVLAEEAECSEGDTMRAWEDRPSENDGNDDKQGSQLANEVPVDTKIEEPVHEAADTIFRSTKDEVVPRQASTVTQSETSIPNNEEVVPDTSAEEGGGEAPPEQELLQEDLGKKTESFEEKVREDSNVVDQLDSSVGVDDGRSDTAANTVEVDWDAIREALNVTRPLGVDPTSSSHPSRIGSDILARLEQQLQDEGYTILRQGPESVVMLHEVRSKNNKKKRGPKRLGGGWYQIW